jgi:signal transduction histidine kinase
MSHEAPGTRRRTPVQSLVRILWHQPLWAIPFAIFFGTIYGGGAVTSYVHAFKISLVFAYTVAFAIWGLEALVLRRLGKPAYHGGTLPLWVEAVGYTVTVLLASYAAAVVVHLTLLPGFLGSPRAVAISGMFALLFAVLFGGIAYAIVFYRQAVERARAVEQMRAELAQAELRALRAQINPHFLFNTLNAIAALIAVDPPAAEDLTTRLADVFRYALKGSERERAPFGEELEFLRTTLAIERARFGERLRVEEAIEPGLEALAVPSLLLQPLVENAVRHGIAGRLDGGTVRLAARREGDLLVVEVEDDGPGLNGSESRSGAGFGLHSVQERLRTAGPPNALDIASIPGRGTRVRVTLPVIPTAPSRTIPNPGETS